uniref:Carboxylesterase type B domain-containing protein n=1 Tax=Tetranychus urticae TaxID=32264 RepID=T1JSF3_TETUR
MEGNRVSLKASLLKSTLNFFWQDETNSHQNFSVVFNGIVSTKYGSLRGVHVNLMHNLQPVEMFLGIPYASPPTGKLRFMPPVTPAHWNGIRMADSFGHVCPQNLPNITNEAESLRKMTRDRLTHLKRLIPLLQNQSEDCLYLNIYTPTKVGKEKVNLQFWNQAVV